MTIDIRAELADQWEELLFVTPGPDSDFFEDGGHSLLAAALFARLSQTIGTELDPALLFTTPTFNALADALAAQLTEAGR
ncbi:phosphopantetheine-binding protein [Kitasatospora sp. MAP5-34]|uniref:phosphopantetheine-binding protein n=1 Tax=Kitasatospora sp. MAP5-34 TaxID=3035102 RepID=UPI00247678F1|nr:phosphopantetheine-binding protein [Kitasatospora sp. MAP5-34]MDH6575302.1 acyl carrier protein [Kitasatospora sp. MAP5-34]